MRRLAPRKARVRPRLKPPMTFLQPFVLLGLPLVLVPVIIHLLNRLRHRPKPWAAMRFLVSATRSSASHTKLRQFLILLCRVLAVAMLVLFLARPLAGGWLGWALSPAPDAIVILLDRSASMETQSGGDHQTRAGHPAAGPGGPGISRKPAILF